MLASAKLATRIEIADAFACHRNRVGHLAGALTRDGMAAVVPSKRGPKGPSKVTADVLRVIDEHPDLGPSKMTDAVAEHAGVKLSVAHVARLINARRAVQPQLPSRSSSAARATEEIDDSGDTSLDETHEAHAGAQPSDEQGQGAVHIDEGAAAGFEPPVLVPTTTRGRYMGATLYYPALAATGLVDAARGSFTLPRSERFGVRAVILTLFFLTLLRKPTVESAKHLARKEFGALVGAGRAPAVKTLRRKLSQLVTQSSTPRFAQLLSRRWVEHGLVATAYLYVDGHMKAYTGKRKLAEMWNSQRRMPLPGVMTHFVGDQQGRPLLFVTEPASSLAKAMPKVIEAIRDAIDDAPFTVIFDRGGYDGKLFSWLNNQGIDFITYQRGTPKLAKQLFTRRETRFDGTKVRMWIAEDTVKVAGAGPWRRIVVRTKDGHQTPILTSLGERVGGARIACLMFARWRQENFFRYMGEHHGLDQLVSYAYDDANPDQMVPNPERKRLERDLAKLRAKARALMVELGDALLDEPRDGSRSAHGLKVAQKGAVKELRGVEQEIEAKLARRGPLPKHVPLKDAGKAREVMRLEHKAIVDQTKIAAYNAEEWLLDRLTRHYRNPHDVRDLLRSFAELSGEMRKTPDGLVVTLDAPDTPAHRRALEGLCEDLNASGATFPGTDLRVSYVVTVHHSQVAA